MWFWLVCRLVFWVGCGSLLCWILGLDDFGWLIVVVVVVC